jgi:hypothetical protein
MTDEVNFRLIIGFMSCVIQVVFGTSCQWRHVYPQLTAQLNLLLLHVSVASRCYLQGSTNVGTCYTGCKTNCSNSDAIFREPPILEHVEHAIQIVKPIVQIAGN